MGNFWGEWSPPSLQDKVISAKIFKIMGGLLLERWIGDFWGEWSPPSLQDKQLSAKIFKIMGG